AVPSPAGRIRCQVFSPPASASGTGARPMMLYLHGGGFTVGQSEDTAYITSRIAAENAMVVVSTNYRPCLDTPGHSRTKILALCRFYRHIWRIVLVCLGHERTRPDRRFCNPYYAGVPRETFGSCPRN